VGVQGFNQLIQAAGGMADSVECGHEDYSTMNQGVRERSAAESKRLGQS
jgi:hypothetical protein